MLQRAPPWKSCLGPALGGGSFKGEKGTNEKKKKNLCFLLTKAPGALQGMEPAQDAASREFRFGNLFPKVGKHSLPNPKSPKSQKQVYFKKTLSSSELKFTLLHGKLLVCLDMG